MRAPRFHWRRAVAAALRLRSAGAAVFVAAVLAFAPACVGAQAVRIDLLPGSTVALRGRTTVGSWSCTVDDAFALVSASAGDVLRDALVRLPASGIRCGSDGMERDLRRALRADRHPWIEMRSLRASLTGDAIASIDAVLEVGGAARPVSAAVHYTVTAERIRLRGALPMRMSDFGIEPPRALLGLVRAHDEVTVEYDVIVAVPRTLTALTALASPLALQKE